jgi:TolB-like protein
MTKVRPMPFLMPYVVVILFLASSLSSGCSNLNDTGFGGILGKDTDLIAFAYDIADNLVDRSLPPLIPRHPEMPVMVATIVDNNDLAQTSPFGRLLQEHMASRLVQHGFTVREIKLTKTVSIEPKSGETVLSRDLSKISGEIQAQAILAGTLSRSDRNLYVSTRLILPESGNILASYDRQLSMDDNLLYLFGARRQADSDQSIAEPAPPRLNRLLY